MDYINSSGIALVIQLLIEAANAGQKVYASAFRRTSPRSSPWWASPSTRDCSPRRPRRWRRSRHCRYSTQIASESLKRTGKTPPLLRPLVAFGEERDVEGCLGRGRLPLFAAGFLAQHGALRIDAQPAAAHALKDVRKHALLVHFCRIHLVVQRVGAIGHGDIAQHAHGDHLLRKVRATCPGR